MIYIVNFNWYLNCYLFFVYTHILFPIYVCFTFQTISISIGIFIFIHIYDLLVFDCQNIYLFKAQSMFMLSLIKILIFNWFLDWYFFYKLMHYLQLVFFLQLAFLLISKCTIYFNWYLLIYLFQLVSMKIYIGIKI